MLNYKTFAARIDIIKKLWKISEFPFYVKQKIKT